MVTLSSVDEDREEGDDEDEEGVSEGAMDNAIGVEDVSSDVSPRGESCVCLFSGCLDGDQSSARKRYLIDQFDSKLFV